MRKKLEPAGKRSPNGKKIVFGSYRKSNYEEVFKMNADGTGLVNLTNNPAYDDSPDWQPFFPIIQP